MQSMRSQRGAMMIEILITLGITVIGLYAILELHKQLQRSEVESYQRTQALMLINDMASRLETNRGGVASYLTDTTTPFYGAGMVCPTAITSVAERDIRAWCLSLQGAAETLSGNSVGALIAGRGCIEETVAGSGQYMLTVAWQGLGPVAAPPASVACGFGLYNDAAGEDTGCVNELCRRVVTTMVRIADL
jgi:type IV pilus assembly protein PilV